MLAPLVIAQRAEAAETPQTVDLDTLIRNEARAKGIDYDRFYGTLACESEHFRDVRMQSEYKNPHGPNGREDSWGIAQIHLPDHPDVTREQAQDPSFAVPWAAEEFKEGRATRWTCYRLLYPGK